MSERTCPVCIETMNMSTRKSVECDACNYSACRECYKRYLLNNSNSQCMSCKNSWSRTLMTTKFEKVFLNTSYKMHCEKVLVEKEMSKLVATQPLVEEKIIEKRKRARLSELREGIAKLQSESHEISLSLISSRYKRDDVVRQVFVRKCTFDDCKGFLSNQWKCGLCENWSCPDCHDVIGKDKSIMKHVCFPDTLATVKLLKSDTKSCPECAVGIFKIDGCDMIFCTECHTSFSWTTGRVIKEGVTIHNPHYFEWLKKKDTGGFVERNIDDIICGREIDNNFVLRLVKMLKRFDDEIYTKQIYCRCRCLIHLKEVTLRDFRINEINDNQDLRIKYMLNELNIENFKKNLLIREKQRERKMEYSDIIKMFISCQTELLYRLKDIFKQNELDLSLITSLSEEMDNLMKYSNECLSKVSSNLGGMLYELDEKFNLIKWKSISDMKKNAI